MNNTDVMLLDAWDVIFIWIGTGANKQEIEEAEKISREYLKTDPSQRSIEIPLIRVKEGFEPPNFTGFFGAWDHEFFKVVS